MNQPTSVFFFFFVLYLFVFFILVFLFVCEIMGLTTRVQLARKWV